MLTGPLTEASFVAVNVTSFLTIDPEFGNNRRLIRECLSEMSGPCDLGPSPGVRRWPCAIQSSLRCRRRCDRPVPGMTARLIGRSRDAQQLPQLDNM
jgi:hypothetical protein